MDSTNEDDTKEKQIKKTRDTVAKRRSNAYAFFACTPNVEFDADSRPKFIVYNCTICRAVVKQGASGLMLHPLCWGKETVDCVMALNNKTGNDKLRQELKKEKRGEQLKLTLLYQPLKKSWDKLCSMLRPSKESLRNTSVGTAQMCAEEGCPFNTVAGHCYKWLQREGQPDCYVPPRQQVSKDVKTLYQKSKEKLAAELQARTDSAPRILLTSTISRPAMASIVSVLTAGHPQTIDLGCPSSGKVPKALRYLNISGGAQEKSQFLGFFR
ncbi:hypothetical protein BT96DRAFT_947331 [Gymnopus androsaceus JB14]|uniref:Uncharacterized protein n=1 Tax=Gymnopus androsaceus JB14 TaxID=1447944 RepID=A0A6A4GST1_9AGAR|nr:hypothetical protein BT96DRAFT_947331 [Gymnopus androsaceus JB14]